MALQYPKGEIVWASYYGSDKELQYIVTSKPIRDCYFLYRVDEERFIKLGKAKTPLGLEKYVKNNK